MLKRRALRASVVVAALLAPHWAGAEIFVVDSLLDGSPVPDVVTLREAIEMANATAGVDAILFSVEGDIQLASPLPTITEAVSITGCGFDCLNIVAEMGQPILAIAADNVSIASLEFRGGSALGFDGGAGLSGYGGGGAAGLGGAVTCEGTNISFLHMDFVDCVATGGAGGETTIGAKAAGKGSLPTEIGGGGGGLGSAGVAGFVGSATRGSGGIGARLAGFSSTAAAANCPATAGGIGAGGSAGGGACAGGAGGFGGGGGGGFFDFAGGNGGYGGGGGGGNPAGVAGSFAGTGSDDNHGGGGGGAGLGGAVFVRSGSAQFFDVLFAGCTATGGAGGSDAGTPGEDGQGKAAGIFVHPSASAFGSIVIDGGGNNASSAPPGGLDSFGVALDNDLVFGTFGEGTPTGILFRSFGNPTNDGTITFGLTTNFAVTGVDATDFSVSGPFSKGGDDDAKGNPAPAIVGVTGSGTSWTIEVSTEGVTAGQWALALLDDNSIVTASSGLPLGGPVAGDATTSVLFTVDKVAPTGSFDELATPRQAHPTEFTVNYVEPLLNISPDDFSLTLDGSPVAINEGAVTHNSALCTLSEVAFDDDADGEYVLSFGPSDITDLAGNPLAEPITVAWTLDNVLPQVVSITTAQTSPTNADSVAWQVTFDEPIAGGTFTPGDVTFTATGNVTKTDVNTSGVSGGTTFGVIVDGIAGDGTLRFVVRAGTVTDLAGNPNVLSDAGPTVTFDNTPPSITIAGGNGDSTNAEFKSLTFTWNEVVTELFAENLFVQTTGSLSYSGPEIGTILPNLQTVLFTNLAGAGNLNLTVPQGAVFDAAGNGNNAQGPYTITVDRVAPSIVSVLRETPSPTTMDKLVWIATFDEPINAATFHGPTDVTVNHTGTTSHTGIAVVQRTPTTFAIELTGVQGEGSITLFVKAGAVQDPLGNVQGAGAASQAIQKVRSFITVGSLTLDVRGATVADLGGGNYDISGTTIVNGAVSTAAALQVRGTTITGSGALQVPNVPGQGTKVFHNGPFTINATTGAIAQGANSATLTLSTVPIGICSMRIAATYLALDGWFNVTGMQNAGFTNLGMSPTALGFAGGVFFVGPNHCASTGTPEPLRFPIGGAGFGATSLSIGYMALARTGAPVANMQINSLTVRPTGLSSIQGSYQRGGIAHGFTGASFQSDGMTMAPVTFTAGTVPVTLTNAKIFLNNTITTTGGSLASGGSTCTFPAPAYNASGMTLGTVTMPAGSWGNATITNVAIGPTPQAPKSTAGRLTAKTVPFDFTSGEFSSTGGFLAQAPKVVNVDLLKIEYQTATVKSTGITFTGFGSFTMAGLPYKFTAATPEGGQGISLEGGLTLPSNISGSAVAGGVTIIGNDVQLDSVSFCTLNNADTGYKIKGSNFNLPVVCFEYDSGPPQLFGGSLSVAIPKIVTVGGGLRILGGLLDSIRLFVNDLNVAIGNTGAFLQDIDAEVLNISRLPRTYEEEYFYRIPPINILVPGTRETTGVPPIQFKGLVGATAGPEITEGVALVRADANVLIDETQFKLDGTVKVVIFEAGGAYVNIRWSGPYSGIAAGGYFVYQTILRGDLTAFFGFDGSFQATGKIALRIPPEIPIIGGIQLASAEIAVSAPPFRISGKLTVLWFEVGFAVDENGSFSLKRSELGERFAPWEVPYCDAVALPFGEPDKTTGKQPELKMSFFTNYRQQQKHFSDEGGFAKGTTGETVDIEISEPGTNVVRLAYETAGGDPTFNVTSPSGVVYTPANSAAASATMASNALYLVNANSRDASYALRNPETGTWQVQIVDPASLGAHAVEVLVESTAPRIAIQHAVVDETQLHVQWTDEDDDSDAIVDISLDVDRQGFDGFRVAGNFAEDDESDVASVELVGNSIAAGWYWPYAKIDDGENPPVFAYADAPIFVPDPDAPPLVENFDVTGAGTTAIARFDPIDDPRVVSYKLMWTDDVDSWRMNFGSAIPAGETVGFVEDLEQNRKYKFGLVATSLVATSAPRRAEKLEVLDRAAKSLALSSELFGSQQSRARAAVELGAASQGVALSTSEARSLAQQARQLAAQRKRDAGKSTPEFERYVAESRAKAALAPRGPAVDERYVDSFLLEWDVVEMNAPAGGNNNPVFRNAPKEIVKGGDLYQWQAVATDIDNGDVVTFELVDGPAAMTVGTNGLVSWQTTVADIEVHEVTVAAIDGHGGRAEHFWRIMVTDFAPAPALLFEIVSLPPDAAPPTEPWTYQPELAGASPQPPVVWTLLDGPAGMTIDAATGVLAWTPTFDDEGDHRVVIRATQAIDGEPLEAWQEFGVEVELVLDGAAALEEQLPEFWTLF